MLFDDINSPRLLIEAELEPLQGSRFQPTGFPDLGAATYRGPGGKEMVLVESVQSMANRLENAAWDGTTEDFVPALQGLSYVKVYDNEGTYLTSSITEAHRLNSPYILDAEQKQGISFMDVLKKEFDVDGASGALPGGPKIAEILARYDVNSLLHGIFFARPELFGGRVRLPRMLSGFIEGEGVTVAMSGGVKLDHVNPSGEAKTGRGNVPFSRQEFTANKITAYFNLDVVELGSWRLSATMNDLLVAVGMYKIQALLHRGMRLRTACDLALVKTRVVRPEGFELLSLEDLASLVPGLVTQATREGSFAEPSMTRLVYGKPVREK